MNNKPNYINNNNLEVSNFWSGNRCEYDEQGRIIHCDPMSNRTNSIDIEYDDNKVLTTDYLNKDDKNEQYYLRTYRFVNNGNFETDRVGLQQEDYYNNQIENKKLKTQYYDVSDDCFIDSIEYYNIPRYSSVFEDRDYDNDTIASVEYRKSNGKIESKDFDISYEEGIYTINKFENDKIIDSVDLGTLVDNYYDNPKCDCGESIRIAHWKGEMDCNEVPYEFEGDCVLSEDGTYHLDDILQKTCTDNNLDYDEMDGFDGDAICRHCGKTIYEDME